MLRVSVLLVGAGIMAAPAIAHQAMTIAPPTAPTAVDVAAGVTVADTQGGAVGTIESVSNGVAVLSTGANKVSVPIGSFAKGPSGLVFAMTKAEIDAKASAATASATAPVEIVVGAVVADQTGAKIGTVKAIAGNMVTVASPNASAQLPKVSFAKGPSGLVIAMSPAEFETAAKAAGGAKGAKPN